MREIKFRVWNVEKKSYVEYDTIYIDSYDGSLHREAGIYETYLKGLPAQSYILEQYIPIYNCYEGDIIQVKQHYGDIHSDPKDFENHIWIGEVIYSDIDAAFCFRDKENGKLVPLSPGGSGVSYTVIGNIHKNAELLEKNEKTN